MGEENVSLDKPKRSNYVFTRRIVTGYNYSVYRKTGDGEMKEVAKVDTDAAVTTEKAKNQVIATALGHDVTAEEARKYVIALNKQRTKLVGVKTIDDLMKIADVIEEN